MQNNIPFVKPKLPSLTSIQNEVSEMLDSGLISSRVGGPNVNEFEKRMADYSGKKYAVGLANCTSGLYFMLKYMRKFYSCVIIPSFTFHASALACHLAGFSIFYCDVDLDTMVMSVEHLDFIIKKTHNTVCVMPSAMFGNLPDYNGILSIVDAGQLISDLAQGIGAQYDGNNAGFYGLASCFSFSASKLITGGEGGCVVTDNDRIKDMSLHGRHYGDDGSYDPSFHGLNARMPEFNAILLNNQFDNLSDIAIEHREIVNKYKNRLHVMVENGDVVFQKQQMNSVSGHKECVIRICNGKRDKVSDTLARNGIEHKKYWSIPLHKTGLYANNNVSLPNTEKLAKECLALPMHRFITDDNIDKIGSIIEGTMYA